MFVSYCHPGEVRSLRAHQLLRPVKRTGPLRFYTLGLALQNADARAAQAVTKTGCMGEGVPLDAPLGIWAAFAAWSRQMKGRQQFFPAKSDQSVREFADACHRLGLPPLCARGRPTRPLPWTSQRGGDPGERPLAVGLVVGKVCEAVTGPAPPGRGSRRLQGLRLRRALPPRAGHELPMRSPVAPDKGFGAIVVDSPGANAAAAVLGAAGACHAGAGTWAPGSSAGGRRMRPDRIVGSAAVASGPSSGGAARQLRPPRRPAVVCGRCSRRAPRRPRSARLVKRHVSMVVSLCAFGSRVAH